MPNNIVSLVMPNNIVLQVVQSNCKCATFNLKRDLYYFKYLNIFYIRIKKYKIIHNK